MQTTILFSNLSDRPTIYLSSSFGFSAFVSPAVKELNKKIEALENTVITLDNEEKGSFIFKICCHFVLGLGLT
jgi:hypothetical protein